MSVRHEARSEAITVEPARRVRPIGLRTRFNRAFFSVHRWPWFALDATLALAFFEIGIRLSPYGSYRELVSPYVALSVVFSLAFATISLGLGSYDRDQRFDFVLVVRNALIATELGTLANLAFHYFTLYDVVGRLTLLYGGGLAFAASAAFRLALAWSVRQHPYRFTVIGHSPAVQELLAHWHNDGRQGRLYVLVPWDTIFADHSKPSHEELVAADIAEIVVADRAMSEEQAIDFALMAIRANVPVVEEWAFYAHRFERLPLDDITKRWILERGLARPQGIVVAGKRLVDVTVSALALLILAPFLVTIALAVRWTSAGPILFVQTRQGRFSQPFRMLKFRTMRHLEGPPGHQGFTRVGDNRVTHIGSFLRRFHLDELPQLLNILRGDMSLVGPRPETVEFARRMDAELPLYELRYLVRPGLTGHAQLKQGYAMDTVLDTQAKLAYDLYYLCTYSMRLDIQIILRTAFFLARRAR